MVRRTATPASRASAIGEGAQYTPLAMRSHEIWRELERETGSTLLDGQRRPRPVEQGADIAMPHATISSRTRSPPRRSTTSRTSCSDAGQIRRRFPQFRVADDESGYFEPGAGFVRPEECVRVQLALAAQHGAQLHRGEVATAFDASDSGVTVTTDRDTYSADTLIVAAGPWLPELVATSALQAFHDLPAGAVLVRHRWSGRRRSCRRIFRSSSGNCRDDRRASTAFRPSTAHAAA